MFKTVHHCHKSILRYVLKLYFFQTESDDGDGDGEQSHDNSYSSSGQQNTTPVKRRFENGSSSNELNDATNDETDEPNNGESSTNVDGPPKKKRRKEFLKLNATFMAGVQGVKLIIDQVRVFSFVVRERKIMCV